MKYIFLKNTTLNAEKFKFNSFQTAYIKIGTVEINKALR